MTLKPGAPGTKRLVEQYGDRLICVRYRYDAEYCLRLKTVELIVDERHWIPRATRPAPLDYVHLRLPPDTPSRPALLRLGGEWDEAARMWRVTFAAAQLLNLTDRISL
ncbi:MAG TPA: hypothetical protein VFN10_23200 [Thermoanaerobaculia bacterium]|nr:hypothetical protein [Thermoanaerobaculia bacterium]